MSTKPLEQAREEFATVARNSEQIAKGFARSCQQAADAFRAFGIAASTAKLDPEIHDEQSPDER